MDAVGVLFSSLISSVIGILTKKRYKWTIFLFFYSKLIPVVYQRILSVFASKCRTDLGRSLASKPIMATPLGRRRRRSAWQLRMYVYIYIMILCVPVVHIHVYVYVIQYNICMYTVYIYIFIYTYMCIYTWMYILYTYTYTYTYT